MVALIECDLIWHKVLFWCNCLTILNFCVFGLAPNFSWLMTVEPLKGDVGGDPSQNPPDPLSLSSFYTCTLPSINSSGWGLLFPVFLVSEWWVRWSSLKSSWSNKYGPPKILFSVELTPQSNSFSFNSALQSYFGHYITFWVRSVCAERKKSTWPKSLTYFLAFVLLSMRRNIYSLVFLCLAVFYSHPY